MITIELNDELTDFARAYFIKAGVASKITQLTGNALEIIPGLDLLFDLVFIDGDKREYSGYFRQVFDKVKPGGFILADNTLWGGEAMQPDSTDQQTRGIIEFNEMIRNDTRIEQVILPLRDGLTIIHKPM